MSRLSFPAKSALQGEHSVELTNMQLVLGHVQAGQTQVTDNQSQSKIEGIVTLHHVTAELTNDELGLRSEAAGQPSTP